MIVGYEVGQAMDTMTAGERDAFSQGMSLVYTAVFEAFSEAFKQGLATAGSVAFDKIRAQHDAAEAAQIVRGVL